MKKKTKFKIGDIVRLKSVLSEGQTEIGEIVDIYDLESFSFPIKVYFKDKREMPKTITFTTDGFRTLARSGDDRIFLYERKTKVIETIKKLLDTKDLYSARAVNRLIFGFWLFCITVPMLIMTIGYFILHHKIC